MKRQIINRCLLSLAMLLSSPYLAAETATPTPPASGGGVPPLPDGTCPLNSGGPSLLGTEWRLFSIYGNTVPPALNITMKVNETTMEGFAGCNNYVADFKQVGYTGFKVTKIERERKGCEIIRPEDGGPTINVGDWEGAYIRTLQRAGSVKQEGNTLHFFNRSGEPSVIFMKKFGTPSIPKTDEPKPAPPAASN